ncbi:hypothetical protein [Streptomyces flavofungini]|uniref:hypothetical protein n=1 Tax=Streptomyces flavofungini TaxID=68200 RepID=UPI00198AD572|nr:hypothetical protein [Streptomyces flavofungini]GHC85996.1 hypothetical protein GCM10010349_71890 [Streptomyces flavofungini]
MGTTQRQRASGNETSEKSEKSASASEAGTGTELTGKRTGGATSATRLSGRKGGSARSGGARAAKERVEREQSAERGGGARTLGRRAASGTSDGRESSEAAERRPPSETLLDEEYAERRPLWVDEPARRPRLPDPVRKAAVRAVLIVSLTLIQAMTAFFCAMAESWLAFPMVLSSVASTVVATWAVCDVWVTRQVWNQRNGVVSMPSSTARRLRRERRRARRQARVTARTKEGIRSQAGQGQLSHS